jgi:hypothetical protein
MRKAPLRGRSHALLVIADFNSLDKPLALFRFRSMRFDYPVYQDLFCLQGLSIFSGIFFLEEKIFI